MRQDIPDKLKYLEAIRSFDPVTMMAGLGDGKDVGVFDTPPTTPLEDDAAPNAKKLRFFDPKAQIAGLGTGKNVCFETPPTTPLEGVHFFKESTTITAPSPPETSGAVEAREINFTPVPSEELSPTPVCAQAPDSDMEVVEVEPVVEEVKSSLLPLRSRRKVPQSESETESDEDYESNLGEVNLPISERPGAPIRRRFGRSVTYESHVQRAVKALDQFRKTLRRMTKLKSREKSIFTRWINNERRNGRICEEKYEKARKGLKRSELQIYKLLGTLSYSVILIEKCLELCRFPY